MGHIPGFTATIFPTSAMPNLSLVANLGLVLFLFLVGLEVDLRFLFSNWRVAASVGLAGMALPFGLGCAIAWGLYHEFRNEPGTVPINFGTYMLFIGVAMAITVCGQALILRNRCNGVKTLAKRNDHGMRL
jgi:Kef-type K+ transport system membrane component KefB